MVLTAKLAVDLKTYLEVNLNTKIGEVGTAIGRTLKEIKLFQAGWSIRLPSCNTTGF